MKKDSMSSIITSRQINVLAEMKGNYSEKLCKRIKDDEINTFDVIDEIKALYILHKMEKEQLSLVAKVRRKRRC
mgnify:FL=1